jgi:perosamine synthetase
MISPNGIDTLPAIDGGQPVRPALLPYGRQQIDQDDVDAVIAALHSDWLTTGPLIDTFERDFAAFVGAKHAVAVSNGTAALHAAVASLNIRRGDEVIVTPMTFAASTNCVLYQGATPVFADVDPHTLLIDPEQCGGLHRSAVRLRRAVADRGSARVAHHR